jgi:uncharacterized protein YbbK (DUF523 family)
MKEKVAVSACLCGMPCRYNGEKLEPVFNFLDDEVIPICPELMGGMFTPRLPGEIVGGTGEDVLDGKARVINSEGEDVTEFFIKGAYRTLELLKKYDVKAAYLKSRSPSCGIGHIYDGTFRSVLVQGDGVTTALLKRNGITVRKGDL